MSSAETLTQVEAAGLRWWVREGSSDWASIHEVAVQRSYFGRHVQVEPGERWLDAGANVGAFTVVAAAAGAFVRAYEPAPDNADLARRNLALNGLSARVLEKAVTKDGGTARLGLAASAWRHSLLRPGGEGYAVPCVSFERAIEGFDGAKLDIEGAEVEILTDPAVNFQGLSKLVLEWHFDFCRKTNVYLGVLEVLRQEFRTVQARKVPPGVDYTWFPPAAIVRCSR